MSEYQIAEYNQTAAALTELRARYVREYDLSESSCTWRGSINSGMMSV